MGVCNVVRCMLDGCFYGVMFDGVGFVVGLWVEGYDIVGKFVLFVGVGGVVIVIVYVIVG